MKDTVFTNTCLSVNNSSLQAPAQSSEMDYMTSLQVAELTGKRHDAVLRDIRNLLNQGVQAHNFVDSFIIRELPNGGSKQEPCFKLTKKGCLILASGYNALLREAIINRWEELEIEKRNLTAPSYLIDDPIKRAEKWIEEQKHLKMLEANNREQQQQLLVQGEQISDLQNAVSQMLPKVSYLDRILQSKVTVCTTQIAQDYGMSAKKFNLKLRELHIQRKVNSQWVLYTPYNQMGYVHSETFIPDNSTSGKVVTTTKWTQKGRIFLYEILKKNDVLPMIEKGVAV